MYLIKFFAVLHFESFPRKPTSEFTVSCLMGFSLNGRRTRLSPDVNPDVGGWTLSTVPPRAQIGVFQRTDCPGGDTSLPGQDPGLEKAGPWACLVAGQGPVVPSPALMSPGHTGPWSWLMNLQICCCVLRTRGPYMRQVIWVNCFSNDKLVIPTSPTVWSTTITELSCTPNFVSKFPPLVCWSISICACMSTIYFIMTILICDWKYDSSFTFLVEFKSRFTLQKLPIGNTLNFHSLMWNVSVFAKLSFFI